MISTRNVALSAAALAAVAQALTVNTPASAVQCQPLALGWGEGTAPYYVSIIPGGQPSAAALEAFPQQSGTSYTWMVDIAAGTAVTVKVVDSTGDTNYSDQVTIQAGTTTDCSSSGSSAASGGSGSSVPAAAAGASSAAPAAGSSSSSGSRSSAGLASNRNTAATTGSQTTANSATAGAGANAAATTSTPSGSAAGGAKAGLGLLIAGFLFALVA